MKKQVLPEREWITIRGRRILWDCFINLFDARQSDGLFIGRSITASQELYSMGYGIQLLTDSWAHGMNTIDEYWESPDLLYNTGNHPGISISIKRSCDFK